MCTYLTKIKNNLVLCTYYLPTENSARHYLFLYFYDVLIRYVIEVENNNAWYSMTQKTHTIE